MHYTLIHWRNIILLFCMIGLRQGYSLTSDSTKVSSNYRQELGISLLSYDIPPDLIYKWCQFSYVNGLTYKLHAPQITFTGKAFYYDKATRKRSDEEIRNAYYEYDYYFENKYQGIKINAGVEKHFFKGKRLQPFIGAMFMSLYGHSEGIELEPSGGKIPGNWYFFDVFHHSLGAEISMGLNLRVYKNLSLSLETSFAYQWTWYGPASFNVHNPMFSSGYSYNYFPNHYSFYFLPIKLLSVNYMFR